MESDNRDPCPRFQPCSQDPQAFLQRAELIIHGHPQCLKNLCRRMTTAMPSNNFLDRVGERKRFSKRHDLSHFDQLTGDPPRRRFFAKIAEKARQFLFTVMIDYLCGGEIAPGIHPHVERAVAHQTETTPGVFELMGRNADIKQGATDPRDAEFVENFVGLTKIALPQSDTTTEFAEPIACMLNRIWILIEAKDICACAKDCFGMTASPACRIYNQSAGPWCEQFDRFRCQHRPMINEIFHLLRLLFERERVG